MISAQLRKSFSHLFSSSTASLLSVSRLSSSLTPHLFFSTIVEPDPYGHPPSKNFESIVLFLKESGFSDTQLEKVLKSKHQQLRTARLEKSIKPKIDVFKDFGFSNAQIAKIIARDPSILCYSASRRVYPSLSFLWDLFGDVDNIVNVLLKTGWFFSTDFKKNLRPNIEFLTKRGVPMERILLLLSFFPRTFLASTERFKRAFERVEELGMNASSKMFIYCLWAAVSMSNEVWDSKVQTLMNLGFTEHDTSKAFMKTPIAFTVSSEKIKRMVKAIVGTNRYTISSIASQPSVLCFSLEKRVKPRLQVLQTLEKRKLIREWPGLSAIYAYTDQKFHECFIKPYPGVFRGGTPPSSGRTKKEIPHKNA